jgi:hypothetical protein
VLSNGSYQLFQAERQLTPFEQREADARIGRCSAWLSDTLARLRRSLTRQPLPGGTMKYLLLVCGDDSMEFTAEAGAALGTATEAWVEEMDGRGVRLQGDRLRPVTDATTVRVRQGEVLVADGPFAETKEQVGGFDILECASLDEALEVAAKHPMATFGSIEVRPFW